MVLLSFHPNGRESANAGRGIGGTKKNETNVHVPCMALRAAHPINMFRMLKCTVRGKKIRERKSSDAAREQAN